MCHNFHLRDSARTKHVPFHVCLGVISWGLYQSRAQGWIGIGEDVWPLHGFQTVQNCCGFVLSEMNCAQYVLFFSSYMYFQL